MATLLTRPLGRLPAGIWVAWVTLLFGLLLGMTEQAISAFSWQTALRLGLQQDDPFSPSPIERALAPVEWGVAVAQVALVLPALAAAIAGLARRHWVGLAAGTFVFSIYLFAPVAFFFGRWGIARMGVGDWEPWRENAVLYLASLGSLGAVGLVALWANRGWFAGRAVQ